MLDRKKLLSADVSATRTGGKAAIVDVNLPAQHIADKYVFFRRHVGLIFQSDFVADNSANENSALRLSISKIYSSYDC